MRVKPNHPLMELLARLLFGIEVVPSKEQRLMVNRACLEVVKWHNDKVSKMEKWIQGLEREVRSINGICPQCDMKLDNTMIESPGSSHAEDCELGIVVSNE